jgi:hypothetical protein
VTLNERLFPILAGHLKKGVLELFLAVHRYSPDGCAGNSGRGSERTLVTRNIRNNRMCIDAPAHIRHRSAGSSSRSRAGGRADKFGPTSERPEHAIALSRFATAFCQILRRTGTWHGAKLRTACPEEVPSSLPQCVVRVTPKNYY